MDKASPSARQRAPELVPELVADLLAEGLTTSIRVTGSSMSPFLRSGDIVQVEPVARRHPRFGDVVVRRHGVRLVVHRLVRIDGGEFQTRGDAVSWPDKAVDGDELLGVVTSVEPASALRRFGLTTGRRPLAWLSARNLLLPLLAPLRILYRASPWRNSGSNSSSAEGSGRNVNS